jgi:hypothetical protein
LATLYDRPTPFAPLTKDDVAKVLGVTPRTVENWVEHEGMPAPASIGHRVYWHPDVFYGWLDQRLRLPKVESSGQVAADSPPKRRPATSADRDQLHYLVSKRIAVIEAEA